MVDKDMADIKVKYMLGAIVGVILLLLIAEQNSMNSLKLMTIVFIITAAFGFAWYLDNKEKKELERNLRQPTDVNMTEDIVAEMRRLREEILNHRPGENTAEDVRHEFMRPANIPMTGSRLGNEAQPVNIRDVEETRAKIHRLRDEIHDYRPGKWTLRDVSDDFPVPAKIRIGVIGVQASGKSSLLNSLHFALTGDWQEIYVESPQSKHGGETVFRSFMKLTDHVITVDTRGITDYATKRVNEVMAEISGDRGIDPRKRRDGLEIDCPIFVFKYTCTTGSQPCKAFLRSLIEKLKMRFDSYPIMVITFADNVARKDDIVDDMATGGMQRGSMFFIENYTVDNHEMDSAKHITLLEILQACIRRADDNITFRWQKSKEGTNDCCVM